MFGIGFVCFLWDLALGLSVGWVGDLCLVLGLSVCHLWDLCWTLGLSLCWLGDFCLEMVGLFGTSTVFGIFGIPEKDWLLQ